MTANASLFTALHPDAPQAWEVSDLSDAGDTAIEVNDRVSVYPPGAWQPRMATVMAVRGDGLYFVQMSFGAKRWCYERDLTLVLKANAAALQPQDGVA